MVSVTFGLMAMLVGFVPGLLMFEFFASPLGPSLWMLSTPFTRIFLTVSQFIRGKGVLVKRKSGEYEIGTYIDTEGQTAMVQLSDTVLEVDEDNITWGLFGKKSFGITWEPGTELHQRVAEDEGTINMGAVHRYLQGTNEADAIDRTEEHSKAEYGGGSDGISEKMMAGLVIVMILLGTFTSYFMLG